MSLLRKAHLRAFKISMSSNQLRNHNNRQSARLKSQPSQLLQELLNLSHKVLHLLTLRLAPQAAYLLFKRESEHKCLFSNLRENKTDLKSSSSKERNTCNLEESLFTIVKQLFLLQLFLMFLLVPCQKEEILWLAMKLTQTIMLLSMQIEMSSIQEEELAFKNQSYVLFHHFFNSLFLLKSSFCLHHFFMHNFVLSF